MSRRRKRTTVAIRPISLSRWQLVFVLALMFAVAGSGLALVKAAQQMRTLHSTLDRLQSTEDRLMAQYSRLLLERSTFASLQTVEVVATQELQMVYPKVIEEVVP